MSQQAMLEIAKEVARDLSAQAQIEASSDAELARRGLDPDEIRAIREGFLDRMLRLGIPYGEWDGAGGCCG